MYPRTQFCGWEDVEVMALEAEPVKVDKLGGEPAAVAADQRRGPTRREAAPAASTDLLARGRTGLCYWVRFQSATWVQNYSGGNTATSLIGIAVAAVAPLGSGSPRFSGRIVPQEIVEAHSQTRSGGNRQNDTADNYTRNRAGVGSMIDPSRGERDADVPWWT
jgi:hypothetical protein